MALHKKNGHGLDIEERLRKQLGVTTEEDSVPETPTYTATHTDTYTHTDTDSDTQPNTYTDTHTDTYGYPYKKEAKSKRLNLLAKPSVYQKLDEYAKRHGDSFNNLIHTLMEEFIDKNGL